MILLFTDDLSIFLYLWHRTTMLQLTRQTSLIIGFDPGLHQCPRRFYSQFEILQPDWF